MLLPAIDPLDLEICLGSHDDYAARGGAMSPPIVQTSLFAFPTLQALGDAQVEEHRRYVYSRGQNPTVEALERQLAELERGAVAKAFGSGMAAVSATIIGLLEAGDHIVFVNQTYGPTLQLAELLVRFGVEHTVVGSGVADDVAAAVRPNTKMLWMESPGTMLFGTLDLRALVDLARSRDLLTCLDNSWATPLFLKPIELGVDLIVHAGSKYLAGHSDVLSGAVVGPEELMEQIFYRGYMLLGASLSPFDAWLQIRGLRTLPLRMRQHHEAGLSVAGYLAQHPTVDRVFHPGLDGASRAGLRGYSGLFSFSLRSDRREDVHTVVDALQCFRIGVSWGGPESLVYSPQGGDPEKLRALGLPSGLIRLSVGLDSPPSLIEDLERALASVR